MSLRDNLLVDVAVLVMACLVVSAAATAAETPPPPATATNAPAPAASVPSAGVVDPSRTHKLKTVTVKGQHDLLSESEARLKKLKDSLPDMDSDVGRKESLAQRVVDSTGKYLANHTDPNKMSNDDKAFVDRVQNGVDATHNAGKPPVAQPDAKDYSDPLCQTGSCPP